MMLCFFYFNFFTFSFYLKPCFYLLIDVFNIYGPVALAATQNASRTILGEK